MPDCEFPKLMKPGGIVSVCCVKHNLSPALPGTDTVWVLARLQALATRCAKNFPQVRPVSPCLTVAVLLGAWLLWNLTLCGRELTHGPTWPTLLGAVCGAGCLQEPWLHVLVPADCWRKLQDCGYMWPKFGGVGGENTISSSVAWPSNPVVLDCRRAGSCCRSSWQNIHGEALLLPSPPSWMCTRSFEHRGTQCLHVPGVRQPGSLPRIKTSASTTTNEARLSTGIVTSLSERGCSLS